MKPLNQLGQVDVEELLLSAARSSVKKLSEEELARVLITAASTSHIALDLADLRSRVEAFFKILEQGGALPWTLSNRERGTVEIRSLAVEFGLVARTGQAYVTR